MTRAWVRLAVGLRRFIHLTHHTYIMAEQAPYDVIVIGSGPGGYVCAIRCAQLGLRTAMVEKENTLGGTCLNVGCIPSKAMLDSSEHYFNATHTFKEHGIEVEAPKVNLPQMVARKAKVVSATVKGVEFLMKKNKIDVHKGWGTFVNATTVAVTAADGSQSQITGKRIVIATGSEAASLPGLTLDRERIITSTESLELQAVPARMIVIGGGVIGLEMGSVYARLGSQVTVVEYADSLIPTMDRELGKEMQKVLTKHLGMQIHLKHAVQKVERLDKGKKTDRVLVTAKDPEGKEVTYEAEYCLVSVGRRPYTVKLNAEAAGVKLDEKGRVLINDHFETSAPGVYAIGDVVRGAMLAHKASDEGTVLAEYFAGQKPHIRYECIPNVVYTWPEVASVGYTEEELKQKGVPYKAGKFPFMASGRARASMDTDGFIKVLAHKETDEVLGVHTIGPRCADVVHAAVVAMEYRASAEDLGLFSTAHPTFAESLKEAALAATENRAIHM